MFQHIESVEDDLFSAECRGQADAQYRGTVEIRQPDILPPVPEGAEPRVCLVGMPREDRDHAARKLAAERIPLLEVTAGEDGARELLQPVDVVDCFIAGDHLDFW